MTEPNPTSQAANVRVMIENLVKSLVDEREQVAVGIAEKTGETVLELQVAPRDVGKVIGKQGRTVRAMRNLLSAAGARSNKRFGLEIIEDELDDTQAGQT
ncbi:MAG: KH domain-containing protein [Terriglobales bacterium]